MPKLDRNDIVRHALALLDDEGLDGLTLRRLADRLNVKAPALYWHFSNKQALIDEMAAEVMRGSRHPDTIVATTWQDWLEAWGTALRELLLDHRDGARMVSGTYLTDPDLYRLQESALAALVTRGLGLDRANLGLMTIYAFTIGFVIEEQAVIPRRGQHNPQYDLADREARIDPIRTPNVHALGIANFSGYDTRYNAGVRVIVRGLVDD
jgi:AcrR family transcriptional regulator